ncbi:MAG: chorismate mutase [Cyclobacteriaceae bacterium]
MDPLARLQIIAGPCSAESLDQLEAVARHLVTLGIPAMRAGVWKPRTRPNSFEGLGEEALNWLGEIKRKFPLKIATEVASPMHVELASKYDMDILWLGTRTTVNPFLVQEIASAMRGMSQQVLVKNPINPDLALWIGAIERIRNAGITDIGAVHRGFSSYQKTKYRNAPSWQIPIELKTSLPDVPLLCDPSHIAGRRSQVMEVAQRALDLDYDGLMIEVHPQPGTALSDADQQLNLADFGQLLAGLRVADKHSSDVVFTSKLEQLRDKIDHIDEELIEILSMRQKLIESVGEYKRENNVTVFQLERWNEIIQSRPEWGKLKNLSPEFIKAIFSVIHDESLRVQTDLVNNQQNPASDR